MLLSGDARMLTLRLSAPSLLAMLSTGLCTLLDALYAARAGAALSGAMSVCFPLLTLIQTVGFTLGMGAGSHVSRCLGAGDTDSARQASSTATALALALGLLLATAGVFFARPAARLLGAPQEALSACAAYARWVLLSAPLQCVGLTLSSLLRGQGRTLSNMVAYVAASALGAALGYALIVRRGLGVTGAGVSLLAREALSLGVLLVAMARSDASLRPSPRHVTLRPWVYPAILRSGLPTLLRQGAMGLSGALQSRICRGFGAATLAGMGVAVRASALVSSAVIGFAQGFQPVCGAAYAAGDMERVQTAYRFCLRVTVVALLVLGGAAFLFADALLAPLATQPEAAAFAARVLRAQSVVFFAQGAVILMNVLTQAMGLTVRATLVAVSRQGLFLPPLLLLLPRLMGETGLVLAQSAADVLALLLSLLLTRGVWQAPRPLTDGARGITMNDKRAPSNRAKRGRESEGQCPSGRGMGVRPPSFPIAKRSKKKAVRERSVT